MSRSAIRCFLATLLVAAASSSAWADEDPARVDLVFGWKPGLELAVTATRTRVREAGERDTRSSTAGYRLRVETEGENLRIQFADPEFDTAVGGMSESPEERAKMMAKVAELMPDYTVTHEGQFVGIHDLPAFQKKLEAFLAEIIPSIAGAEGEASAAAVAGMKAMLTSEAFLNSRASEEWNAIVGAWSGGSFTVGVPEEYSRDEPVAAFAGNSIRMNYSFAAEEIRTCERGGVERRCAVLVMRSKSDPEETKALIESILQGLAPDLSPQTPMFRALSLENVLRVTTEPDGLIPHAYSLTKMISGSIVTPDGEQSIEQIDTTEVRYSNP